MHATDITLTHAIMTANNLIIFGIVCDIVKVHLLSRLSRVWLCATLVSLYLSNALFTRPLSLYSENKKLENTHEIYYERATQDGTRLVYGRKYQWNNVDAERDETRATFVRSKWLINRERRAKRPSSTGGFALDTDSATYTVLRTRGPNTGQTCGTSGAEISRSLFPTSMAVFSVDKTNRVLFFIPFPVRVLFSPWIRWRVASSTPLTIDA